MFLAPNLHSKKCPHLGRYSIQLNAFMEKRKRREQPGTELNIDNFKISCKLSRFQLSDL